VPEALCAGSRVSVRGRTKVSADCHSVQFQLWTFPKLSSVRARPQHKKQASGVQHFAVTIGQPTEKKWTMESSRRFYTFSLDSQGLDGLGCQF
jgi:hypothetical protein